MSSELDDRHRFFLRHAEQIREWASLEAEVRDLAHSFLTELVEHLHREGGPWGDDVHTRIVDGAWPGLDLYRHGWRTADGEPIATVRLEWSARDVGLDMGSDLPFVGIRAERGTAPRAAIDERVEDIDSAYRNPPEGWWPAWRYVPPELSDSLTLSEYSQELTQALADAWIDLAPVVDAAAASVE